MESYARGDRVTLREPLGPITTGELGIIVEVYGRNETPDGVVVGTKDFEMHGAQTLFDYGVLFTSLGRSYQNNGPWKTDKVDVSQFAFKLGGRKWSNVNVVPLGHDELRYVDSEMRGVL